MLALIPLWTVGVFVAILAKQEARPNLGHADFFPFSSRKSLKFEDDKALRAAQGSWSHNIETVTCSFDKRINSISTLYHNVCHPLQPRHPFVHGLLQANHRVDYLTADDQNTIIEISAWKCDGEDTKGHICAIVMYTALGVAELAAYGKVSPEQMLFCGDVRGARYDKSSKSWPATATWTAPVGQGVLSFTGSESKEIDSLGIAYGKPFTKADCDKKS